jgi:hypothetical protein
MHGLALGKKFVMHQTLRVKESDQHFLTFDRTCLVFSMSQMSWTDSTLFLRMIVVAFRTFLWPSY